MNLIRAHCPPDPAIQLAVAAMFLGVSSLVPLSALSQTPAQTAGKTQAAGQAQTSAQPQAPVSPPTYMGRTIAQTMHYTGAEWLIRENRESEERSSQMLAQLNVKPRMTVCDMGCGNGFHSIKLARLVGAAGSVLGVDVQPEMLRLLDLRAKQAGVENIKLILGTVDNPGLPDGKVDLILCVDVYHEFSDPESMLREMREALVPKGQLVLVEFRAEDPNVPIQPLHKMSKAQIRKELGANGFRCEREFDGLPWQHMMFFTRE
jgi:SAM-dependent methyltransferase